MGREAVLDEAVRRALPAWYEEAIAEAGVATVGDPKIDLGDLPEKGAPLEFSIEVGVRPPAEARRLQGRSRSAAASPRSIAEEVDAELERLRESLASLENVDARPPRRATSWCSTSSARSTASRSRAARPAAICSSSARTA